jgi:predicted enzyme related to lactoylglutathione lyase
MAKVTGIGGVFFKVKDPSATRDWYARHLGLNSDEYGTSFEWRQTGREGAKGFTLWSPFSKESDYFEDQMMINFRVDDLDGLLADLKSSGIEVASEVQSFEYGRFVHIRDNNGTKIELWEPIDSAYDEMIGDARTK